MTSNENKQSKISERFKKVIQNNQLQHAYIFEGVKGTGKYEMAKWIGQSLHCQDPAADGSPCLSCNHCLRIQNDEHPDITTIEPDGLSIKIDQVRQIKEDFSKGGMESQGKVLIIKEMDKMTTSATNSLLKFIEEPEGKITIFLLTTEVQRLLPTIISRCQVIHFPTRSVSERLVQLQEREIPAATASILVHLTQDVDQAVGIYESEKFTNMVDMVWQWFSFLNRRDDRAFIYVQTNLMGLINNRQDSSLLLDLLLLIYRDLLSIYYEQNKPLAFSKYEKELKKIAMRSQAIDLSNGLTFILEGKKKLNSYVSAQGIFEQITLNLIGFVQHTF